MQQTTQHQLRDLVYVDRMDQLQDAVDNWRMFYNNARVHSTTKMVPFERYFKKKPSQFDMRTACELYELTLKIFKER